MSTTTNGVKATATTNAKGAAAGLRTALETEATSDYHSDDHVSSSGGGSNLRGVYANP